MRESTLSHNNNKKTEPDATRLKRELFNHRVDVNETEPKMNLKLITLVFLLNAYSIRSKVSMRTKPKENSRTTQRDSKFGPRQTHSVTENAISSSCIVQFLPFILSSRVIPSIYRFKIVSHAVVFRGLVLLPPRRLANHSEPSKIWKVDLDLRTLFAGMVKNNTAETEFERALKTVYYRYFRQFADSLRKVAVVIIGLTGLRDSHVRVLA